MRANRCVKDARAASIDEMRSNSFDHALLNRLQVRSDSFCNSGWWGTWLWLGLLSES